MSKHTPGPFVLVVTKDGGNWEYDVRTEKPHNPAGGLGKHVAKVNKYLDDPQANGALLAAAPDLLEACREAKAAMGRIPFATTPEAPHWQDPMLAAYAACESAIAKAEGGAA